MFWLCKTYTSIIYIHIDGILICLPIYNSKYVYLDEALILRS